jgi:hypothetical protein
MTTPVKLPANLKPGTYSVKATQNGIGWCSQPVDVVSAASAKA